MKNSKTVLSLISLAAIMCLASCGGESGTSSSKPSDSTSDTVISNSQHTSKEDVSSKNDTSDSSPVSSDIVDSSVTPDSSSSPSSVVLDAAQKLEAALRVDYSNMTVVTYDISEVTEESTENIYYADDYQVVQYAYGDDTMYQYFHDYNNESYQWFSASTSKEHSGWLKQADRGIECGLGGTTYVDARKVIQEVKDHKADIEYMSGIYFITDEALVNDIVNTCFAWCPEVEADTFYFTIDSNTNAFKQMGIYSTDIDTEKNASLFEIRNIDNTSLAGLTLPEAPNSTNVLEYWQYKGFTGPQVNVYPKSVALTVTDTAHTPDSNDVYTLEIEETLDIAYSIEYDVDETIEEDRRIYIRPNFRFCSDRAFVADAKYVGSSGNGQIVGISDGDAQISATVDGENGTIVSNVIKVHVNPLAAQNLDGAVYNFSFTDMNNDGSIIATNILANSLPYDISANKGCSVITAPGGSLYAGKKVIVMRTGNQDTMQDEEFRGDAYVCFDFADQQVSGISMYYGQIYSNNDSTWLDKIAIQISNDGTTWTDACDITDEIKNNVSEDNRKLLEKSFAPSSKVRIVLEGKMIGKFYGFATDQIAFIASDACNAHDTTVYDDVTGINISAEKNATSVKMGQTLKFNAVVNPSTAKQDVVWHVSDEAVATISADGVLTPVSTGNVTVTATSSNGVAGATVTSNEVIINVLKADHVEDSIIGGWYDGDTFITVTDTNAKIDFGSGADADTITLNYTGKDDSGYDIFGVFTDKETPSWLKIKKDSAYTGKADYSLNIVGVAGKPLKVNVYASNNTLSRYVKATSVDGGLTSSLYVGKTATFIAHFFGEDFIDATEEAYKISVADNSIISIEDGDGNYGLESAMDTSNKVIKGIALGKTKVTITTASGLTKTVYVDVEKKEVNKITVNLGNGNLSVGDTTTATATVDPSDADDKSVTWSSSDTSIATVDASGKVTAVAAGTVTITATANDGSGTTGSATLKISDVAAAGDIAERAGEWGDDETSGSYFTLVINADGSLCMTDWISGYGFEEDECADIEYDGTVLTFTSSDGEVSYEITFNADGTATLIIDGEDYLLTK